MIGKITSRKIYSLLMIAVFCLSMCSCSESSANSTKSVASNTTVQTSETVKPSETKTTTEMTTTTEATTTVPHDDTLLSDGPCFLNVTETYSINSKCPTAFELYQYSLKTQKWYLLFSFKSSAENNYCLPYEGIFVGWLTKQAFDSKFERLAVSWFDQSNESNHVGWIDREGRLTDVTDKIHPYNESSFSSIAPRDKEPVFTSDDKLVFRDANKEWTFSCYDPESGTLTENIERGCRAGTNMGIVDAFCLDDQNRPTLQHEIQFGDYYYDFHYLGSGQKALIGGYSKTDEGYVFFETIKGQIGCFGPGFTEQRGYRSDGSDKMYDFGREYRVVTPQSQWQVASMAYSNNNIVFIASQGSKTALFSMTFNNGAPSDPVQLRDDVKPEWGELVFWIDDDLPIGDRAIK